MVQARRGRPEADPGDVPEPHLKQHPTQPGVWIASGRPRDWNGVYRRIYRSSPPETDSRGRSKPDRSGERARRAYFEAAEAFVATSRTEAETLTMRSTFAELWAAYQIDHAAQGHLSATLGNVRPMMRDTLLPVYAGRILANFTTGTIESMLRLVAVERGGAAPRIARENLLAPMFRFAARMGLPIADGLVKRAKNPPVDPGSFKRRRGGAAFVETTDVAALLVGVYTGTAPCPTLDARPRKHPDKWTHTVPTVAEFCEAHDVADWAALVAATGWRHGQSLGVLVSDIDWDTGVLTPTGCVKCREVDGQMTYVWVDCTGVTAKGIPDPKFAAKPVLLPTWCLELLKVRRKRLPAKRLKTAPRLDDADWPEDLLFLDPRTGGPRNEKTMGGYWRRIAAALELPEGMTPHSLRKWVGTEGVDAGLDVTVVTDQLGNTVPILRGHYVKRGRVHPEMAAVIETKLGPAVAEVTRLRSG